MYSFSVITKWQTEIIKNSRIIYKFIKNTRIFESLAAKSLIPPLFFLLWDFFEL